MAGARTYVASFYYVRVGGGERCCCWNATNQSFQWFLHCILYFESVPHFLHCEPFPVLFPAGKTSHTEKSLSPSFSRRTPLGDTVPVNPNILSTNNKALLKL